MTNLISVILNNSTTVISASNTSEIYYVEFTNLLSIFEHFHLDQWNVGGPGSPTNTLRRDRAFEAIQAAELVQRGLGLAIQDVFFPGSDYLRENEKRWRESALVAARRG